MTVPNPPSVFTTLEKFRAALLRQDEAALRRLIESYKLLYGRLLVYIDALLLDIEAKGIVTAGQLVRMARYKTLIAQVVDELNRFGALTEAEMIAAQQAGINLGINHAKGILKSVSPVSATFASLPAESISTLTGFLLPDSPLIERIRELAPFGTSAVINTLKEAIGLGYSPRKTAGLIRSALGDNLTSALRMTRTVQLYSYREAARATYLVNGITEWVWVAKLDDRTCLSCISKHGTKYPITEKLNDHYNGRCGMVPVVEPFEPLFSEGAGERWFVEQDEARQQKLMGKGKFEAWKDGAFRFSQLSKPSLDPVYGVMAVETPLKDLIK